MDEADGDADYSLLLELDVDEDKAAAKELVLAIVERNAAALAQLLVRHHDRLAAVLAVEVPRSEIVLRVAVKHGNFDAVRQILDACPAAVHLRKMFSNGSGALHEAFDKADFEMIRLLLDGGASLSARSFSGWSVLHNMLGGSTVTRVEGAPERHYDTLRRLVAGGVLTRDQVKELAAPPHRRVRDAVRDHSRRFPAVAETARDLFPSLLGAADDRIVALPPGGAAQPPSEDDTPPSGAAPPPRGGAPSSSEDAPRSSEAAAPPPGGAAPRPSEDDSPLSGDTPRSSSSAQPPSDSAQPLSDSAQPPSEDALLQCGEVLSPGQPLLQQRTCMYRDAQAKLVNFTKSGSVPRGCRLLCVDVPGLLSKKQLHYRFRRPWSALVVDAPPGGGAESLAAFLGDPKNASELGPDATSTTCLPQSGARWATSSLCRMGLDVRCYTVTVGVASHVEYKMKTSVYFLRPPSVAKGAPLAAFAKTVATMYVAVTYHVNSTENQNPKLTAKRDPSPAAEPARKAARTS
ncbi:hypothetical protein M885DRAFT_531023 [Pelagophyceae sp. CCMP2097]|nr:hypothetical protein M885DRAFT_531023 [Pelagophyceae sp. CCMP2097]